MPKHYFTPLANRPMRLGGFEIRFEICSISAGKAAGIYEATDPAQIAVLDDAVRGRRGVKEIGAEEYATLKKKATQTPPSSSSNVSRPRVVRIPLLPEVPMDGRGSADSAGSGAVKPGQNIFSGPAPTSPPPTKSLIRVEKVNPPKPFATADQKVRKASERADRAKVRVVRPKE